MDTRSFDAGGLVCQTILATKVATAIIDGDGFVVAYNSELKELLGLASQVGECLSGTYTPVKPGDGIEFGEFGYAEVSERYFQIRRNTHRELPADYQVCHFEEAGSLLRELFRIHGVEQEKAEWEHQFIQIVFSASHDLNEPVDKTAAFLGLLKGQIESLDDEAKEFFQHAVDANHRMQSLLESLLVYSRLNTQAQPMVLVSLEDIMLRLLKEKHYLIERRGVRIERDRLPDVVMDPHQAHLFLSAIFDNALKFHLEDSQPLIQIKASEKTRHLPDPQRPGLEMPIACVQIEFRDNGIGFENNLARRIFRPFQRLHPRGTYSGNGMGLAIAERIIKRHKGIIGARSAVGKGTQVKALIPFEPF